MADWISDAVFYHIYPLGMCGAPHHNSADLPIEPRVTQIGDWIAHVQELGVNAVYLGPVFESSAHGYDTIDYYRVDRRLGDERALSQLTARLHDAGIRVILDGVFHHVGREFWAFRDLQANGPNSPYRDWFTGVDFSRSSPHGDQFTYDAWEGHFDLVRLNLNNADVRAHLLGAVRQWIEQFAIDGLRLDVAYALDRSFMRDLAALCRSLDPQFWLLGETIHGDYRELANPSMLDSVTNYEAYKGLYSSHNDHNYFEIAHTLRRQFAADGLYHDLRLYTFADNHDVQRIASTLRNPAHLYPLHALLFTMPGIPSIYYGSEWGIAGSKQGHSDWALRPALRWPVAVEQMPHPDLAMAIARFSRIRHQQVALRDGSYEQLLVASEQIAFARQHEAEQIIVVVNAADSAARVELASAPDQHYVDLLDPAREFSSYQGRLVIDDVAPCWARILLRR